MPNEQPDTLTPEEIDAIRDSASWHDGALPFPDCPHCGTTSADQVCSHTIVIDGKPLKRIKYRFLTAIELKKVMKPEAWEAQFGGGADGK